MNKCVYSLTGASRYFGREAMKIFEKETLKEVG
jgi:hypothetical protein